MVLWGLARPHQGVSLPAVVTHGDHKRHRGGNSTPLDIPVIDDIDGDRSGPVTKVQRRVGVTVHPHPAPGAHPPLVAEPKRGMVAATAMVGLRRPKPPVSHHQPSTLPGALVRQHRTDPADPGLGDTAAKRAAAHPPAHRSDIQVFNDHRAVTACQPAGERVELVGAEVGCAPVQLRQLGARLAMPSGADDTAGSLPRDPAALPVGLHPRGGMGDPLDGAVIMGDRGPLGADAKVDPTAAVRLAGHARLEGDDRLHRHLQPPTMLAQGHRQNPRPPLADQAFQAAGVLLGTQPPDHRQDQVAAVRLQPHRAGGEPDPAPVATTRLEPWKAHPCAGCALAAAVLGLRPVVKRRHQVGDTRGICLLGAGRPPRRHLMLGPVPPLAQLVEAPRQQRDRGVGLAGVEVRFNLRKRPVVREAASTKMLRDPRRLL